MPQLTAITPEIWHACFSEADQQTWSNWFESTAALSTDAIATFHISDINRVEVTYYHLDANGNKHFEASCASHPISLTTLCVGTRTIEEPHPPLPESLQ